MSKSDLALSQFQRVDCSRIAEVTGNGGVMFPFHRAPGFKAHCHMHSCWGPVMRLVAMDSALGGRGEHMKDCGFAVAPFTEWN